jgi:sugar phosphate permease
MKARWHYAWLIVVITFIVMLFAAGVRTIPGILIKPLEAEFGWDRSSISFAVAISLFVFGLGAPIAGTLIDRFGPKKVMLLALVLTAAGLTPLLALRELWQLHLFWGLLTGIGTGGIAGVLGATVANRWFNKHRGMIVGIFSGAAAAGQFLFVPMLISLTTNEGWRVAVGTVAVVGVMLLLPVVVLMRNRPEDIGLEPVGGKPLAASAAQAEAERSTSLREALRTRDFWLLAGSFFVCGYTTNGLIGTHLLPHTVEHGFVEVETAGALALMGIMNMVGTLISGWLSDKYDNRKLLSVYYGLRALSLVALPFVVEMRGLLIFAVIYGLDWVATVPPTVNLTAQRFGRASVGTIYGWIFCSHMIGAGLAAQAGGLFRDIFGDYHLIFLSAALMGFIASGLTMRISVQKRKPTLAQA